MSDTGQDQDVQRVLANAGVPVFHYRRFRAPTVQEAVASPPAPAASPPCATEMAATEAASATTPTPPGAVSPRHPVPAVSDNPFPPRAGAPCAGPAQVLPTREMFRILLRNDPVRTAGPPDSIPAEDRPREVMQHVR
jgi:hypothetical protein